LSKKKRGRSRSKKPDSNPQKLELQELQDLGSGSENQNINLGSQNLSSPVNLVVQNLNGSENQDPQSLELQSLEFQNQDLQNLNLEVIAAKAAVQQQFEDPKLLYELVEKYTALMDFPQTRNLLLLLNNDKGVPVDVLTIVLMTEYRKTNYEAEVIINKLVSLGLVIPRAEKSVAVFKKRRARGCREVYCSLDTPPEQFNLCCEVQEIQQVVLKPTPVLEELIRYYKSNQ